MEKEIMDKFIKENKEEIEIEYRKNWGVMLEAIITVAKNLYNWWVSLQVRYKKDKEPTLTVMTQKEVEYKRAWFLWIKRRTRWNEMRITQDLIIDSNWIDIWRVLIDWEEYVKYK